MSEGILTLITFLFEMIFLLFVFLLFTSPIWITVLIIVFMIIVPRNKFKKSSYYTETHNEYSETVKDKGLWGEYLTWSKLHKYEADGAKLLANCYLPKDNFETSEVDLIMLHPYGIFVIESKNYSGWIFGSEDQRNWTQTLPNSEKNYFYNPIKQNQSHIKWLKKQVGDLVPFYSVVTFSERCTLKKITVTSSDVYVINRDKIQDVISHVGDKTNNRQVLSQTQINDMYNRLYPFTQVSEREKMNHIQTVQDYKEGNKTSLYESDRFHTNDSKGEVSLTSQPQPNMEELFWKNRTKTVKEENQNNFCTKCGAKLVKKQNGMNPHSGYELYECENYFCDYTKYVKQ